MLVLVASLYKKWEMIDRDRCSSKSIKMGVPFVMAAAEQRSEALQLFYTVALSATRS